MLVGAGTVLDSESARMAIVAGASFILTPTLKKRDYYFGESLSNSDYSWGFNADRGINSS